MNCKIFLVAGILLASSLMVLAIDETQAKYHKDCMEEVGNLTPAEVQLINDDKVAKVKDAAASNNLKCYMLCVYKKNGIITADGKQNPEAVIKYMGTKVADKNKMMPVMASCASASMKSDDPCATVYAFEECVMSKI